MSDALDPPPPPISQLQYTDRSRHETRIGRCPRAGYLSTAFGPDGYGIQRKAVAVPLASGTMMHDAFEGLLTILRDQDELPTDGDIRTAIGLAHAKYDATVTARGLQYWEGDTRLPRMVREQKILIEGLIWCFAIEKLPLLHAEYRIVCVEQEEVTIYGCTCGHGDGIPPYTDHIAKGCQGIGLQSRADWIAQHRESGLYTYHEFKSFGSYASVFAGKWETNIQPYVGAHGWEARTGETIAHTFIHGLNKSQRKKERQLGDVGRINTGPEYQDSRLVYGYCNPNAIDLHGDPDWQQEYEWVDPITGKGRKLGKDYQKTLTDLYPGGVEAWVRSLSAEQRQEQVLTIGPLLPKPEIVDAAIRGWVATEQDVQQKLWELHEAISDADGDWTAPAPQAFIDAAFPQSWQCDRYGPKHRCEFLPICERRSGWRDPITFLEFIPRRPHHTPEQDQAIARGLLLPEDLGDDGGGDE